MMSFLSFHAAAVARGDGLRPELLALLVDVPAASHPELTLTHESMVQSRPDRESTDVVGKRASASYLPQASARQAKQPGFVRETAKSEMGHERQNSR